MKVGLILECGPQGADKAVCEYLANLLNPEIEIVSLTLDNKPGLIENCAEATQSLLELDHCDRVVIIWDLYPAWRKAGERPSCIQDRAQILEKLDAAGINIPNVFLVCIVEELEAWLLSEHQAISAVLSRPHRAVRIRREQRPERVRNPKARLIKYFEENVGKPYDDRVHAKQIVQNIANTNRLRRCRTFVRFALKVAGIEL
ncbi:MAG: DUF4276 family protein [Pyrinomonadaceae bacterium]